MLELVSTIFLWHTSISLMLFIISRESMFILIKP